MKVLGKLGAAATVYSFLRSPAGQRLIEEVKRQAGDPENRRRVADLLQRLRPGDAHGSTSPGGAGGPRARP